MQHYSGSPFSSSRRVHYWCDVSLHCRAFFVKISLFSQFHALDHQKLYNLRVLSWSEEKISIYICSFFLSLLPPPSCLWWCKRNTDKQQCCFLPDCFLVILIPLNFCTGGDRWRRLRGDLYHLIIIIKFHHSLPFYLLAERTGSNYNL